MFQTSISEFQNSDIVLYETPYRTRYRRSNQTYDIVGFSHRYRRSSTTISMFNIVHDIGSKKDIGYDIQLLTTFIQHLTTLLPRLLHVCAEELQQLLPDSCTRFFLIATASSTDNSRENVLPYFHIQMLTHSTKTF